MSSLAPLPADVEYHRVYAGEKRRIGRGILAITLLLAGLVLFPQILGIAGSFVDTQLLGRSGFTPISHATMMISLALLIPWSMLIQRMLYRVPGRSLHSVASRFRPELVGRTLLVFGPVWVIVLIIGFAGPVEEVVWSPVDLLAVFAVTLILTPLQAAGEEYGIRGLMLRVIGGWTRNPRVGLIAAIAVTSVFFTALHFPADIYSAIWYLSLWTGLAVITWRTGGLEVAVVLHAILNTLTFLAAALLRLDLDVALDVSDGRTTSPYQLIPAAMVLVTTAVVWWWTRKSGPALTPSGAGRDRPSHASAGESSPSRGVAKRR